MGQDFFLGSLSKDISFICFLCTCVFLPGNKVPFDDIRTIRIQKTGSEEIFYTMTCIALFGCGLSLAFLWFNIMKRDTK